MMNAPTVLFVSIRPPWTATSFSTIRKSVWFSRKTINQTTSVDFDPEGTDPDEHWLDYVDFI